MNAPTEYRRGAPALGAEIFCHAQATEQRCRVMRTGFFCPWSFCGRPRGERRYVKRGMIHFDNPAVDDFVAVRASRGHKDQQLEPDRREALQSKADANHGFQQIAIRPLPCFVSRGSGVRIPPPRPFQDSDILSDMAGSGHASAFHRYTGVDDFVADLSSRYSFQFPNLDFWGKWPANAFGVPHSCAFFAHENGHNPHSSRYHRDEWGTASRSQRCHYGRVSLARTSTVTCCGWCHSI